MRRSVAGVAAVLCALLIGGCSGGGSNSSNSSSGSPAPPAGGSPSMQVLPATFDFGKVTTGNTPAPLEVTVRNTGAAPLRISLINFTAASSPAFALNFAAGTRPCGSAAPVLGAGESCTFRVAFQPSGNGVFASTVQIASNDNNLSLFGLPITGAAEAVNALAVRILQVETSCPVNAATAYVSVIDQGGYPLLGLNTGSFTVTEGDPASANLLRSATLVDAAYKPLAMVAVVDNSGSITNQPVAYAEMKSGFASLFNGLRGNDVGELINFGTEYEVTVAFPSPSNPGNPTNKAALVTGLAVPWTKPNNTLLYDSVHKAVDDAALQTAYRRAVVVATDGVDEGDSGVPVSKRTIGEVIANAVSKKVPIFTIGIGSSVNASVLQDMATQTGGTYYVASTSQNLALIYQQLTSLLFQNQYALTFDQLPRGVGKVSPLRVDVVGPTGIVGNATSTITSCN